MPHLLLQPVEKVPHDITSGEEIDELFATTFDIIRETTFNGTSKICDFIGEFIGFTCASTISWFINLIHIIILPRAN